MDQLEQLDSRRMHAPAEVAPNGTSQRTSVPRRRVLTYTALALVLGIVGSSLVTASVMRRPSPSIQIVTPAAGDVASRSFAVQILTRHIGVHDSVWLVEDTGGPDYFPMQAKETKRGVWSVAQAYVFDSSARDGTTRTLVAYVANESASEAFGVYNYLGNKDPTVFAIGMRGLPHGLRAEDRVTVHYRSG